MDGSYNSVERGQEWFVPAEPVCVTRSVPFVKRRKTSPAPGSVAHHGAILTERVACMIFLTQWMFQTHKPRRHRWVDDDRVDFRDRRCRLSGGARRLGEKRRSSNWICGEKKECCR